MKKIIFICAFAVCVSAQSKILKAAERPLRISYTSPTVSYLPLWVAKELGSFRKNGVEIEIISIMSQLAINALFANEIDIVAGGVGLIYLHWQGNREAVAFASLNSYNKLDFSVYAHSSITNPSLLRGKRFGITRLGGAIDLASRHFLKGVGLDPNKDLVLLQTGSVPDLLQALTAGSVDAATFPVPQNFIARDRGFRELADLAQGDGRFPGATFVSKRQYLVENKTRAESFVRGLIEGIHFTKTRRRESLEILSRYTRITDPKILGASYDYNVKYVWPEVPEVRPTDMKLAIEGLAESNPRAPRINVSDMIYGAIVENVVKSGGVPVDKRAVP